MTEVPSGRGPARDTILLGKYRVDSILGYGGMGLVIKAHNMALDEFVAIKLLREDVQVDDQTIQRFVREAKNAFSLTSEHVARIRDVGQLEDGRPYMVMELLEGLDLGRMLAQLGRLDRRRAVDLVLQACDAIAEAHAIGIVHRDIKPTNLFVTRRRDGTDLLKVLDFGISKARGGLELSLTQTSSVLGTPTYMSPEQMRSARVVDPRSDIWSLGTVLYELVEGRPPFDASNFAELCVMVATEPHAPPRIAHELAPVIERCLAKQLELRYQDVAQLAFDLHPFASEPERARRQVRRIFRVLGREHPELELSLTPIPRPEPTPLGHQAARSTPVPRPGSPPVLAPPGSAPVYAPPGSPVYARPGSPPVHARPSSPPVHTRPDSSPFRRDRSEPVLRRDASAPMMRPSDRSAPMVRQRKPRSWKLVVALVAIFGIGTTVGLLAVSSSHRGHTAVLDAGETSSHVMRVEPAQAPAIDAGLAGAAVELDAAVAIDAGVAATAAAGTATTAPIKHIVKKPRKPVAPPPKPKCDPFDNPNGCPGTHRCQRTRRDRRGPASARSRLAAFTPPPSLEASRSDDHPFHLHAGCGQRPPRRTTPGFRSA